MPPSHREEIRTMDAAIAAAVRRELRRQGLEIEPVMNWEEVGTAVRQALIRVALIGE